jgi:Raf kinase inhibitor-like YbhB/YbcL family protein
MRVSLPLAVFLLCAVSGCGENDTGPAVAPPKAPGGLRLSSPAFADRAVIPRRYTCDGAGKSPPLRWRGVPPQAAALALVVTDPDAPGGRFAHWTLYALPPQLTALPAGLPVLGGSRQGANSFGKTGWGAPCPPKGARPHRYEFDLYWLRRPLDVAPGAPPDAVVQAIGRVAGGHGRLVGLYARRR